MVHVNRGRKRRPRKIVMHSAHKVGKSTWASKAPEPIFADCESGLGDIDCNSTDRILDWDQLYTTAGYFLHTPRGYRTFVLDTLDWAERLCHQKLCREANASSINSGKILGYGEGYRRASIEFDKLLKVFDAGIQNGIGIIILSHSKAVKVEEPGIPAYTHYAMDVHDAISSMVCEWADDILFANTRVYVRQEEAGFNRTRGIAAGGTERYVLTSKSAIAEAGNRCGLPEELPLEWDAYEAAVRNFYATAKPPAPAAAPIETQPAPLGDGANIGGLVVNGSSKVEV